MLNAAHMSQQMDYTANKASVFPGRKIPRENIVCHGSEQHVFVIYIWVSAYSLTSRQLAKRKDERMLPCCSLTRFPYTPFSATMLEKGKEKLMSTSVISHPKEPKSNFEQWKQKPHFDPSREPHGNIGRVRFGSHSGMSVRLACIFRAFFIACSNSRILGIHSWLFFHVEENEQHCGASASSFSFRFHHSRFLIVSNSHHFNHSHSIYSHSGLKSPKKDYPLPHNSSTETFVSAQC